tara:strand:+ start:104 stop:232 length:129 start_codon:yes stop_codon:yes gene_type:complete
MIRNIIELLKFVKNDTESIAIAKGKYKMPESFKEMFQQIKNK